MGLPRTTAFRFGQGHSKAVFNFYFNSMRDQKRARQIYTLERVATLFLGCDMTLRTSPAASKVHQDNETTKAKKDDTNIHVLNWGGPPLGVQNLYTFPTPKTGIKQIEQFNMSPRLRKKAQDAQDAVLRFLKFSVSVALTRRLRFLRFLRFSVYYAIYKMNRGFEIFEGFSFNRTDKAFEIFCPTGTRDTIILLEGVPKQVATKGPAIIPPKALRILVRICSQVPAKDKVLFLLHALGD